MSILSPASSLAGGIPSATTGSTSSSSSSSSLSATSAQDASDRFLKLLVTQLKNQDPMNPVDNAQMTSQMAEISTVSGIEKLNTTVEGLNTQFMQMQALQGASLVGKDVLLPGNKLSTVNGAATGTFQIDSPADNVKVDVLGPAGQLVDSLNLGASSSGRQDFSWPNGTALGDVSNYSFKVTAYSGSTPLTVTTLMRDTVDAVNTTGSSLTLELARSGHVAYSNITALD